MLNWEKVLILEADELMEVLKLPINYSIVTNIDLEHLDYIKVIII